ncbi:cytochrome P450 [Actinocrispum wychmicini]|uniref:Cytochrome P450 n=1 Tax=Actinocrispum wychmicini TaxID=1213861 RepID=A0A4R2JU46_9PSEU|nr:cytochrome P450 [Actinocrispum wychmicini]TCO60529.1 cytochrome P450 [Actinocrispum wychmicini]
MRAEWHETRLLWASRPALFALLRTAALGGPVWRAPKLGWLVTDPVVARRVLNDPKHFTLLGEGGVGHLWAQVLGDYVYRIFDGPGHADLRARARDLFTDATARPLVRRVFTPALEPAVERLRAGGVVDVADLTRVLVGRMMADMLGLDLPADDERYREVFGTGEKLARLALGSAASTELPPDVIARAKAIIAGLTKNVPQAYAEASADTLLGRCRELGLSLEETSGLAALLMVAGTETAATAMTRILALLHDTGQQHLLRGESQLMYGVISEGLRVTTPAPVIGRSVSRDITVGRTRMRAGDRVLLLTHVANNRIGRFDITGPTYIPEIRQLWFGAGRHLCLGAALARAEIRHFLDAMLGNGPIQIVSRRPAKGVLIPSYAELRVTIG